MSISFRRAGLATGAHQHEDGPYGADEVWHHTGVKDDPYFGSPHEELSRYKHDPDEADFHLRHVPLSNLHIHTGDGIEPRLKLHDYHSDPDDKDRLDSLAQQHPEDMAPGIAVHHNGKHLLLDGGHRAAILEHHGHTHMPVFVTHADPGLDIHRHGAVEPLPDDPSQSPEDGTERAEDLAGGPQPAETGPACPYCGNTTLSAPQDNGRAERLTCETCQGTVVGVPGQQYMPDLIGSPHNHPSMAPDERSGGVGGVANDGVVHTMTQRTADLDHVIRNLHHLGPERMAQHFEQKSGRLTPVKHAGFAGYVEHYEGAHEEMKEMDREFNGGHDDHDYSLYDRVAPDPNTHERAHEEEHDELPSSYHERHDEAFGKAKQQQTEDEAPIAHHRELGNFLGDRALDHDYWNAHAETVHMPLKGKTVYATQPHVVNEHVARYLRNPQDKVDYVHNHGETHHAQQYAGTHMPMWVHHQGNYFAIEGHHRTSTALMRGDSHLKVSLYDADKHGLADEEGNPSFGHDENGDQYSGLQKHSMLIGADCAHPNPTRAHAIYCHDDGVCTWTEARRAMNVTASAIDPELRWHFTAAWIDVQNKATRIAREGGVHIMVSAADRLGGVVRGDHDLYETQLNYVPGSRKVGYWSCGCRWGSWAWGRSPAYQRFEGRMCSHALALQFEALKQHAFREVQVREHDFRPAWMRDKQVTVHHQRATERDDAIDHRRSAARETWADVVARDGLFDPWAQPGVNPAVAAFGRMFDEMAYRGGREHLEAVEDRDLQEGIEHLDLHHPPAYAFLVTGAAAHEDAGRLVAIARETFGFDQDSARRLVVEALNETFLARHHHVAGNPLDEFRREILMVGEPEHYQGNGGHSSPEHKPATQEPSQTDEHTELGQDSHGNVLDPNQFTPGNEHHRTEDARQHAPEHGAGLPDDEHEPSVRCQQCQDQGCGHCGGAGQVDLDDRTRIPDQNADAGSYSRNQGLGGGGIPTMGSLWTLAEYSSYDWQGDPVNRTPTRHVRSDNPAQTGWATAPDPADWSSISPSEKNFDSMHSIGAAGHKEDPPAPAGPTHAGVCLKAHDTGRVLMLQRSHHDEADPARGKWEFPGGGLEDHDATPMHGAVREHEEETGMPFPGGEVHHVWTAHDSDGSPRYQGFVVGIPSEEHYPLNRARSIDNPDDDNEQLAWWHPDEARGNKAVRKEVHSSPWAAIKKAGPQPEQKAAVLMDHPEPALPVAEADDDSTAGMGATPGERVRSHMHPEIGSDQTTSVPSSATHTAAAPAGADVASIVANFQATAGAAALNRPTAAQQQRESMGGEPGGGDVAAAARAHLSKEAMASFSPSEQRELIEEGRGGPRARNFGDLKISGTHYADIPEDEVMFG